MSRRKKPEVLPTRDDVFATGRESLAAAYTFFSAAAADHALPLSDQDRTLFRYLRARASGLLDRLNEQGRN